MLPLLSAGLTLAPIIYKGIQGYKQQKEANKINPVRPNYSIPSAINEQVDLYRGLSNQSRLPGQYLMEDQLKQAASNGINALQSSAGSPQDIIAGATKLAGNQVRSLNDLVIAGAQNQARNQSAYANSLSTLAGYQDQEFNINKMVPYLNDVNRKQALLASANQNLYGSLNDLGNWGSELNNQNQEKKMRLAELAMAGLK